MGSEMHKIPTMADALFRAAKRYVESARNEDFYSLKLVCEVYERTEREKVKVVASCRTGKSLPDEESQARDALVEAVDQFTPNQWSGLGYFVGSGELYDKVIKIGRALLDYRRAKGGE